MSEELPHKVPGNILDMLYFPALLINQKLEIISINQECREFFWCAEENCSCNQGTDKSHRKASQGLCHNFYLEMIELFLNFPGAKKSTFNQNGKVWELNCKKFDKDLFLFYAINKNFHEIINDTIDSILKEKRITSHLKKRENTLEIPLQQFEESLNKPFFIIQNQEIKYFNSALIKELHLKAENLDTVEILKILNKPLDYFQQLCQSENEAQCETLSIVIEDQLKQYRLVVKDVNFNGAMACSVILNCAFKGKVTESTDHDIQPSISKTQQDNEVHVKLKVLLVEDQQMNQKVLKTLLEAIGCVVELADNGQTAVEKVREASYDIILMDIQMPIMDGLTASKIIKNTDNPPPIIAITIKSDLEEEVELKDYGINDFIAKPPDMDDLVEKILYWVQQEN